MSISEQPITKTKTIEGRDGFSMNECVMVLPVAMFDMEGKLYRHEDGRVLSFDYIWTHILQMDEQVPEGENLMHDILVCRVREMAEEFPGKHTPEEWKGVLRDGFAKMYECTRRRSLSNKQFIGTSADKLEDFKKNGIPHDAGLWLTEEDPWNAEGCHPWSHSPALDENAPEDEDEREPVKGLILEVDLSQLSQNCIFPQNSGLITYYAGTIPWSAVTRYAILDWEKIDDDWEHFVTHRMPGSPESAVFTRWLMGYPVTVKDFVWPLRRGFKAEDMSPESNRAWTRYEWDGHPDMPQDGFDDPDHESTVEACPIEDRKWYVEDTTDMLKKRDGIELTVLQAA
jgi:hypothetical protein